MRNKSSATAKREMTKAEEVLKRHRLPPGIERFQLEAAEDQDGDPVMWVWLDGEDTSSWNAIRRDALSAFLSNLKRELYEALDDYRPHFRMRTLASRRR
jgi:hypothetical protein